jgi:hypothetical protein
LSKSFVASRQAREHVVADLTALGLAWLNASTTGIRLAAVGAGVAILSLAIAEMSRTERLKPPP